MADAVGCPNCGAKGRKVDLRTLQSLLTEDARARLNGASDLRFCKATACKVVYYREDEEARFVSEDVRVVVFQKSNDSSRLVCYCFEHRVADIEDEVVRSGTSIVPDRIAEQCRQGLARCEEMNPQGACCLGNVRQVIKGAMAKASRPERAAGAAPCEPNCCASEVTLQRFGKASRPESAAGAALPWDLDCCATEAATEEPPEGEDRCDVTPRSPRRIR